MANNLRALIQSKIEYDTNNGCWLWTGRHDRKGYGRISLAGHAMLAHRVSYEIHNGDLHDKAVLHSCHTPMCVNPSHLRLGTNIDNVDDRLRRLGCDPALRRDIINLSDRRPYKTRAQGRKKSPRHGIRNILSPDQVREIRKDCRKGVEIARHYGITVGTVSKIRSRKLWPTLPD